MARMIKMTEDLQWNSLKEQFYIGTLMTEELERDANGNVVLRDGHPVVVKTQKFVNELKVAAEDGTLDSMVENCATVYHGGVVDSVLSALARNVSSAKCNLNKRSYAPNKAIDEARIQTLTEYIASRRGTSSSSDLPQWAYGPTEIDSIDDPAVLQKIINSISDVCSDKAFGKYADRLGEDYVAVAKANRKYARERKAKLEAKANQVDPVILEKLGKGGKVTLTAEQAALLAKLLEG